ncbi:MAG TPA: acyltransferase domain-containing protein [Frankiaceae bacterium]|nr:acyltransferase domain-containing protein [Frankiaceae bacterium]
MLAVVAPGQGAQTPGFLTPWLDLPEVARRVRWAAAVVGRDLVALGTTGSEDDIRDTAACQPLLVAVGIAVGRELLGDEPVAPFYAGHSVGELTAAALAGALSDEAALVLARERGAAMADAAALAPTGMSAVLGGAIEKVEAAVAEAGLEIANRNGAGQVVAAGPLDALATLPQRVDGARVVPLKVAGAFHTSAMASAQERLAVLAGSAPPADPCGRLLSNADGTLVATGRDVLDRLVQQVTAPVRWDLCMATFAAAGVTAVVELPPAGTLTALVRRDLHEVTPLALRTPDDLAAARRLVTEHTATSTGHEPAWRVVVAPAAGAFTAAPVARVNAGAALGSIAGRRETTEVVAPYGGVVVEWLALDGDPVKPGQPLVRLHPLAAV